MALGSLLGKEASAVDYLTSSLLLGVLGFLYFAFAGYELSSMLQRANGEESLASAKASGNLVLAEMITLLMLLFFWSALVFGFQVADYYLRNLSYPSYLSHALKAVFLYVFMPGVLGILLGIILREISRATAYCWMILITLLCSPVALLLYSGSTIAEFSLASVLDWFAITVPNSGWTADAVYGVGMETCRWVLAAFWTLLFLCILFGRFRRERGRIYSVASGLCLFLSLLCGVRFALRGDDCIVMKDSREAVIMDEDTWRDSHGTGEVEEADFQVEKYDLSLTVNSTLEAEVTMKVSSTNLDSYCFTLYHGYEVSEILDEEGEALSFTRDGDFLDVQAPGNTECITIRYSGNGNKYYANSQGISLPGYFAWYPMAGHLLLWDEESSSYTIHADFPETDFLVQISCGKTVYSNLSRVGENTFEGTTDTVSLFAGLLTEMEVDGVLYVYSPVGGQTLNIDSMEVSERWEELCVLTGETRELSLEGKKLFLEPLTILSTAVGSEETVVVLEDHVLLCNSQPTVEGIVEIYFENGIPTSAGSDILRETFLEVLFSEDLESVVEKPAYENFGILFEYESEFDIEDDEELDQWMEAAYVDYYNLMLYQIDCLGKEEVLRAVYSWLMEDGHEINQIDFLYYLEEA
ncbi:MAG: hypothetical protein LUF34_08780 [Lachnospiraceae bacterium]|nr:hypothetical protein [Lachnospiraceae bacterium]